MANFDVSATGGLSGAANSHITVDVPVRHRASASYTSGQVLDVTTSLTVGSCSNPVSG